MLVVNLFGGPSCGKSTTAAGLFFFLKKRGLNVEIATEYAKELVYEGRLDELRNQMAIFTEQRRRVLRPLPHCQVVITDSPTLLSGTYHSEMYPDSFRETLLWDFNQVESLNFVIERAHEYSTHGRHQTEAEADNQHRKIVDFLIENDVPFIVINGDDAGIEMALEKVVERVQSKQ